MAKKGNAMGKKARIVWTEELRLGLYLLKTDFDFGPVKMAAIFAQMFDSHLRTCGLPEVFPSKLNIQYCERNKPAAKHLWTICDDDSFEVETMRDALKARIAQVAQSSGLDRTQETDDGAALPTPPRSVASASRKRIASFAFHADSDDETPPTPATPTKKLRLVQAVDPTQRYIPPPPPCTPRLTKTPKTPKSQRRLNATVWHEIKEGVGSWLTPEEYEASATYDPVPPPEHLAQPNLTTLLYRLWGDNSQSPLKRGFTAKSFSAMPLIAPPPPPSVQEPLWNAMATHFQRAEIATPFVSCSMNLCWIIRQALKAAEAGEVGKFISVLDPSLIPKRNCFHAIAYHYPLKRKRCFHDGAQRYHVPAEAVIRTIKVADIFTLTHRLPAVSALLRLDQLVVKNKGYLKKILPTLRAQNVALTPSVIRSIADVAKFLGLSYDSSIGHVSGVVSGITQDWGINITRHSGSGWLAKAQTFAHAMDPNRTARPGHLTAMEEAFMDGVRWGCTKEANPRLRADRARRALRRARMVGLESPAKLLVDDLDAAKLTILSFEKAQLRALPASTAGYGGSRRPLLIHGGDDGVNDDSGYDEEADEDDEPMSPPATPGNAGDEDVEMCDSDEIAYDSDMEDGSVHEL